MSGSDDECEPQAECSLERDAPAGAVHDPPPLNQIEVQCGPYIFSSKFDSGNMARAEVDEDDDTEFNLWTNPDCAGKPYVTTCRSWFYFSVRGGKAGDTIGLNIMNSNVQHKLYKKGYKPVWRSRTSNPNWAPVPSKIQTHFTDDDEYIIRWEFTFPDEEEVMFAFCYPHSFTDTEEQIAGYEAMVKDPAVSKRIVFHREVLHHSLEGRPLWLLTLSSPDGMKAAREEDIEGLFPAGDERAPTWQRSKKIVFISARVHPGETPASHVLNGALDLLMRLNDARASALRRNYVFKIVPLLNPDGVARGHYRTDTLGQNLNRLYNGAPNATCPTLWAVKKMLQRWFQQGHLYAYFDLHAHATKRGCFVFGNNTSTDATLIETITLAKLMSLNSPHFDFSACNFTEKNMNRKDRREGLSKSGSGRVNTYRETGLTHVYTLECNYNNGKSLNAIKAAYGSGSGRASPPRDASVDPPNFKKEDFEGVGRGMLVAILDLQGKNPWSRLPNTRHKSLEGVTKWVATFVERSRRRGSCSTISMECGEAVEVDTPPLAAGSTQTAAMDDDQSDGNDSDGSIAEAAAKPRRANRRTHSTVSRQSSSQKREPRDRSGSGSASRGRAASGGVSRATAAGVGSSRRCLSPRVASVMAARVANREWMPSPRGQKPASGDKSSANATAKTDQKLKAATGRELSATVDASNHGGGFSAGRLLRHKQPGEDPFQAQLSARGYNRVGISSDADAVIRRRERAMQQRGLHAAAGTRSASLMNTLQGRSRSVVADVGVESQQTVTMPEGLHESWKRKENGHGLCFGIRGLS